MAADINISTDNDGISKCKSEALGCTVDCGLGHMVKVDQKERRSIESLGMLILLSDMS